MKRGECEIIERAAGFNSRDDHTEFSHAGAVGRRLQNRKFHLERVCHQ
jgi:hypothetical protein